MAKVIYDIMVRITITYGSLVGTTIVLAGIVHLFMTKDGATSIGVITIGAGLILGRSLTDAFSGGYEAIKDRKIASCGNSNEDKLQ